MGTELDAVKSGVPETPEVSVAPPVEAAPAVEAAAPEAVVEPAAAAPARAPLSFASIMENVRYLMHYRKNTKLDKIMDLARDGDPITNDDAQWIAQCTELAASRLLDELVQTGRLRRTGTDEKRFYEVA